jgi:hypothetical protein
MTEVIEEFFVPIKKVKPGEAVVKSDVVSVDPPNPPRKKTALPTQENHKVQAWMQKNSPRRGRK